MQGIFHAVLHGRAGAGGRRARRRSARLLLWRRRSRAGGAGASSPATVAVTAWWAFVLLHRSPRLAPVARRRWCSSAGLARRAGAARRRPRCCRPGPWRPSAGAALVVVARRPGGLRRADRGHRAHRLDPDGRAGGRRGAAVPVGGGPGGRVRRRRPGRHPCRRAAARHRAHGAAAARPSAARHRGRRRARRAAGWAGLLQGSTAERRSWSALLRPTPTAYTWVAAAVGSNNRPRATSWPPGDPVMAIGGFNGSDPSPTLAQFQAYVAAGQDPLLHRRRRVRAARAAAASARARSRRGWRRTSPPRPSAGSPSTTSPPRPPRAEPHPPPDPATPVDHVRAARRCDNRPADLLSHSPTYFTWSTAQKWGGTGAGIVAQRQLSSGQWALL